MKIRQPLKTHGGKYYLAKHIHRLAAKTDYKHRVITHGGGLGEFWNWHHKGISEVVNDTDLPLTNFWRVLQSPRQFSKFERGAQATPFGQEFWQQASCCVYPALITDPEGDWHAALNLFINVRQSRQGLGKDFATLSRNRLRRGMSEQVSAWLSAIEGLPEVHARLKRVVILNDDALKVIKQQDGKQTLFYLDPTYLPETRAAKKVYRHEMTKKDHIKLLKLLATIKGKFLLSGYPSALYKKYQRQHGWNLTKIKIDNKASSKKTKDVKTECIWRNY
ncbi:hypothetical protein LCGC14_0392170 [marine sediment metagenome]|uniref:Site-specific DNA-methyltransferase (adenine-specific) n=1 Tax=marine sediment metagenome TaxID=412755 RepID=A0A0F9W8B4_9ZZZZ